MIKRVWVPLCLCVCMAACGENAESSVLTTDASMPLHMDMSMVASDMEVTSDQSVRMDVTTSNSPDMTADMTLNADAMLSPDMSSECIDGCVDSTLTWGRIGGFTPYNVVYTLSPCNTQAIQIDSFSAVDPDALRCERIAPGCTAEARITLPEVMAQFADILASNAFDFGAVYGVDSRPVDGQVFSIVYQGRELLLGDPCEGSVSECTNPPRAVLEFADLLWDFGREMENTEPSCAHIRDEL